ncbi:MAG: glycine/sarcosine/betaine reductase component B subunit [Bilophila wadsworthia]
MKLELHRISVGKLAFGAQTGVSGGVLTINKDELASLLLQDDRLSAVAVDVAHPGENVRIMPVKDAIEPRCKLEGPGEVFPGWIGDVKRRRRQNARLGRHGRADHGPRGGPSGRHRGHVRPQVRTTRRSPGPAT